MDFEAHLCVPSKAGCCLQKHHKGAGTPPVRSQCSTGESTTIGDAWWAPCPRKHWTKPPPLGDLFFLVPYQTSFCLQTPEGIRQFINPGPNSQRIPNPIAVAQKGPKFRDFSLPGYQSSPISLLWAESCSSSPRNRPSPQSGSPDTNISSTQGQTPTTNWRIKQDTTINMTILLKYTYEYKLMIMWIKFTVCKQIY